MSNFQENLRLRLAQLDATWEELAAAAGENAVNIRAVVRRGTPQERTLRKISEMVGVPMHELLAPNFDPRVYPVPDALEKHRRENNGETVCDKFNDGDREEM